LPIVGASVSLSYGRRPDLFGDSTEETTARELQERLKEERKEAERRSEQRKKEQRPKPLGEATPASNTVSSTLARETQELTLEQARRKIYAHLDQLKIASEHEERENELRQRAVINAAAAVQAQLVHDATIKLLQDAYTSNARNSSDRADFGDRGSSSSHDKDHGNPSRSGASSGGVSLSSNGSGSCRVSAGGSSNSGSGSGICVNFDGHHYAGSHCSHGGRSGGGFGGGGEIGFR